ncbi:MAG: type IV-A pilus assembly ATPase PilB [Lysobacterales bacterium]
MATQINPTALSGLPGFVRRLVVEGVIGEDDARKAIDASNKQKIPLVSYLVQNGLAPAAQVAFAASVEFGIPLLDIDSVDFRHLQIKLVQESLIQQHKILPLFKRGSRLFVGITDPTNLRALDDVKFQANMPVDPVIIPEDKLDKAIERALAGAEQLNQQMGDDDDDVGLLNAESGTEDEGSTGTDVASGDDTPVVKFINKVLLDAIKRGASDIHFEPYEAICRVRLRIDGMLKQVATAPMKLAPRIAARIKVMSGLDIAERRLPQDGRIKLNISKTKSMDFRVSTCPTLFGEKCVLRILDASAAKLGIEKLGYEEEQQERFLDAISKPYGMVLVTGPTGSGKTVSLYTALNILNTDSVNISTCEDPVEIRVHGINQVQQNTKKGMTFATALRSFLRQDPDIIMVGEIRDLETAEIAIKAAQTGHFVLSTLHTNDAPQTVARLMNMGIAPYNITSSVTLITAQRLARRLHDCKKAVKLPRAALLAEGFSEAEVDDLTLYEPNGCSGCNEGYKGRVGIYQVMPMSEEIQKIVLEGGNAMQIAAESRRIGINDLRLSALKKVRDGMTSLAEINRVTKD